MFYHLEVNVTKTNGNFIGDSRLVIKSYRYDLESV